ncbi:mechanosensitive ion channel family protein [Marinicrinis sediminis]|uniref:Mechanosensitive ion channel family protein n=1 Tax=Marinicrinis sediminis TaxID=1652465 RepID=A0ABW5RBW8_9BACL
MYWFATAAETENKANNESIQDQLMNYFQDPSRWMNMLGVIVKIVVIFIAAKIVIKISKRMIQLMLEDREKKHFKLDARRSNTIGKLVGNVITYTINFIAILLILSQLNFDLMPLLAGAGVLGLAIGFGAQNLVRDVITGFFIIFEDQFAVGDIIQTGQFKGTVEEIGLRITKIKNWTGEIHYIPNGSITEVTNFSINNSISVVDVSVAYEVDVDTAIEVIKATAMQVYENNDNMVKEPDVLGVQSLGASDVVIRVLAECKPYTHFAVARQMNAEMKKALDAKGIEIPYPRLVTYHRQEETETA